MSAYFFDLLDSLQGGVATCVSYLVGETMFEIMGRNITRTTAFFSLALATVGMWTVYRRWRQQKYPRVRLSTNGPSCSILDTQWPIVYSPQYNIRFYGLERIHAFDSVKWGRVYDILQKNMVQDSTIVEPPEATYDDLLEAHTEKYLESLNSSYKVAMVTEVPPIAILFNCWVQQKILRPLRFQTAGSIIAAKLAMQRGWAINIGGGFHHCHADDGGGFCVYADITLAIKFLFKLDDRVQHVMIIDLDAHQGNGHEHDFMDDKRVYIMDMYNKGIYPRDEKAKRGIRRNVPLQFNMQDAEYLHLVNIHVTAALKEFPADIVIYNAGTDILEGDPLGQLSISAQGIVERDELVFRLVREQRIPIVMLTSGGYQRRTAEIIADSVINLRDKGLITLNSRHVRRTRGSTEPEINADVTAKETS